MRRCKSRQYKQKRYMDALNEKYLEAQARADEAIDQLNIALDQRRLAIEEAKQLMTTESFQKIRDIEKGIDEKFAERNRLSDAVMDILKQIIALSNRGPTNAVRYCDFSGCVSYPIEPEDDVPSGGPNVSQMPENLCFPKNVLD